MIAKRSRVLLLAAGNVETHQIFSFRQPALGAGNAVLDKTDIVRLRVDVGFKLLCSGCLCGFTAFSCLWVGVYLLWSAARAAKLQFVTCILFAETTCFRYLMLALCASVMHLYQPGAIGSANCFCLVVCCRSPGMMFKINQL